MKKFTFIAEFKNGTYISQYKADNLMEAVLIWADNLDVQFFTNKVKTKIQEKVRDSFYSPVSIEEVDNVWWECNLNSVWFLFLLNHNKYNFFFWDLQMLLKVVFGCVQGRRRMSRLYTLAHIRELPFLCV